jgi:hypothetical protein
MEQSERVAAWVGNDPDKLGYLMNQAAQGSLGDPPSDAELAGVDRQIMARRERMSLEKAHPPGTREYIALQPRIQTLYAIEFGGTPLCGRDGRRV